MPQLQVVLEIDSAAYDAFTGGTIGLPMNEREGAIIATMLDLLLDRDAWQPMTDLEWETQQNEIVELLERLQV